jgi:hypothetical protein
MPQCLRVCLGYERQWFKPCPIPEMPDTLKDFVGLTPIISDENPANLVGDNKAFFPLLERHRKGIVGQR